MKRAVVEFTATLAALGAVSLYMQLSDPTSWLRLRLEESAERFRDWRLRSKVDDLIDSIPKEV